MAYLPFNYDDLQVVLEELEQQAGGGATAVQFKAAADTVRAYCEQHGREKLESYFVPYHQTGADEG